MRRLRLIALVLISATWGVHAAPEAARSPQEAANSAADPALEARVMKVAGDGTRFGLRIQIDDDSTVVWNAEVTTTSVHEYSGGSR